MMTCNIKKKLDVNGCSLAQLTLILLPHYRVKCRSRVMWLFTTTNSYCSYCFWDTV